MNWDQIRDNWLQFKDRLRHNWAKLTDEDITRINGRREELVSRLQERYGFAKTEAEREIGAWMRAQPDSARPGKRSGPSEPEPCRNKAAAAQPHSSRLAKAAP